MEKPVSKNLYHVETSQFICNAGQLTAFYMMQVFSEIYSVNRLNINNLNDAKKQGFQLKSYDKRYQF